jgi:hypothetical protein
MSHVSSRQTANSQGSVCCQVSERLQPEAVGALDELGDLLRVAEAELLTEWRFQIILDELGMPFVSAHEIHIGPSNDCYCGRI